MFIEILFKIVLFKAGVLIYAEHCIYSLFVFIFYRVLTPFTNTNSSTFQALSSFSSTLNSGKLHVYKHILEFFTLNQIVLCY